MPTPEPHHRERPNVLWIFGDQHRAQALSCAGDGNLHTPHIDRLATEGVTLEGVSGYPLCCPYRGALLSGRYPHECVPGHEKRLPEDMATIARPFGEAGYRTIYLGKWHVDGFHESTGRAALHTVPRHRRGGFDTWLGYENNNSQYDCYIHGHDGDSEVERYRLPGYETDALTDMLIEQLRRCAAEPDRPFFAALSVQPPHGPYVAPAQWMGRHNPARIELRPNVPPVPWITERARRGLAGYYAMIENLDWNLGRIREALAELDLADSTHIIFFSDHGDMHGCHGQFAKTAPWEESIRVPMIIGGGVPFYDMRGGRSDALVNYVDVAPTSLGLCGITPPSWMAGTDYSSHRQPRRPAVSEPDSAYLQLIEPTGHRNSVDRPWRGVLTRDGWKYICLEGQPWLLFNLREDPYELANHAHNPVFSAQRKRLHDRLAAWVNDTGDRFTLPQL